MGSDNAGSFDEILSNKCFYKVLGMSKDVSQSDLRKAYLKRSMKAHPDKNTDDVARATEAFQKVAQAYDVLGDPDKRKQYDMISSVGGSWSDNGTFGGAEPVPVSPAEAFAMFTQAMEQYAREQGIETERQETVFDSIASGLLAVDRWWFGEDDSSSGNASANTADTSASGGASSREKEAPRRLQGLAQGMMAVGSFMSTLHQIHEAQRVRDEEEMKRQQEAGQQGRPPPRTANTPGPY
jgi:curved DNA-binding protein CbpA